MHQILHFLLIVFSFTIDINEFYTYTLEDSSKPAEVKTVATHQLAEKWENISPPIPAGTVEIAKKILDDEVHLNLSVIDRHGYRCLSIRKEP